MKQVRLGGTGLKVSELVLGMMSFGDPNVWHHDWLLPPEAANEFVGIAADVGITFFDTADMYSYGVSEEATGAALKNVFARREEYVVATKVYMRMSDAPNDRGLSRVHIMASVDNSLRRLGLDHIDLYQIHRWDDETPIEETMEALHDCIKSGKIRYIGASSMYAWQFAKAQHVAEMHGWTKFISMSPHYNLLFREEEREMIPLCVDSGVGVLPWSPLARGLLTRPADDTKATERGQTDERADFHYQDAERSIIDAVGRIAESRGVSRANVALAWLLHREGVTAPIIGATKPEHIRDAAAATELQLESEEIAQLESPYTPQPIRTH